MTLSNILYYYHVRCHPHPLVLSLMQNTLNHHMNTCTDRRIIPRRCSTATTQSLSNRDSPLYHHDTSPGTVDDTQSSRTRYQHVTHLYYPPAHVLSLDPLQIPPRPKHHTTFYQFVIYSKLTKHYSNNRLTSIHPFPLMHLLLDNPTWHEHRTKKSSGKSKETSSTLTQTSIP